MIVGFFIAYFLLLGLAAWWVLKSKTKTTKASPDKPQEETQESIKRPNKQTNSAEPEAMKEAFKKRQDALEELIAKKNGNSEKLSEMREKNEQLQEQLAKSLQDFESLKEIIEQQRNEILGITEQGVVIEEDDEMEKDAVWEDFHQFGEEEEIDDPEIIL